MREAEWTPGPPPIRAGRYDVVVSGLRMAITITDVGNSNGIIFNKFSASHTFQAKIHYDDGEAIPLVRWGHITYFYKIPDPIPTGDAA